MHLFEVDRLQAKAIVDDTLPFADSVIIEAKRDFLQKKRQLRIKPVLEKAKRQIELVRCRARVLQTWPAIVGLRPVTAADSRRAGIHGHGPKDRRQHTVDTAFVRICHDTDKRIAISSDMGSIEWTPDQAGSDAYDAFCQAIEKHATYQAH